MTDSGSWRHSRTKRMKAALIPALVWPVVEFFGGTYHWNVIGKEHVDQLTASNQPYIVAIWHGRIWAGLLAFREYHLVAMISENFDGEWIARVAKRFGADSVRGSSSRGGGRALVQMRRELQTGRNVLFTLDGPRGPARVAQPGAVWPAKVSGGPIVPVRIEAKKFRTATSWDRHQLPSPGTTVTVVFGPPISVPPTADADTIEATRLELENALNAPVRV